MRRRQRDGLHAGWWCWSSPRPRQRLIKSGDNAGKRRHASRSQPAAGRIRAERQLVDLKSRVRGNGRKFLLIEPDDLRDDDDAVSFRALDDGALQRGLERDRVENPEL